MSFGDRTLLGDLVLPIRDCIPFVGDFCPKVRTATWTLETKRGSGRLNKARWLSGPGGLLGSLKFSERVGKPKGGGTVEPYLSMQRGTTPEVIPRARLFSIFSLFVSV